MAKKDKVEVPKATKCPITRADFDGHAKPIAVKVGEQNFLAEAKQFSTGSMGWGVNEKTIVTVNGVPCKVQVGLNLTVVGSKELPK